MTSELFLLISNQVLIVASAVLVFIGIFAASRGEWAKAAYYAAFAAWVAP